MLQAFESKFPIANMSHAIRAITFFDDVVGDMPKMLKATTWKRVTADPTRIAKNCGVR